MNFKQRNPLVRVLLLSGIIATSIVGMAPVHSAPIVNRLLEADPMAAPILVESSTALFDTNIHDDAPAANNAPATVRPALLVAPSSKSDPGSAPATLAQRMRNQASGVVNTALNFLGMPYRHGGTSESTGFDCSGFTRYMFEMSVGLVLPRLADQQAKAPGLAAISRSDLQPGDLVFFNTLRRTFSHVGIYVGDGKFIHAPKPGAEVRVEDMGIAYWASRFTGARRADPDVDPMAGQAMSSPSVTMSAAMPFAAPSVALVSNARNRKPVRHNIRHHRR